VNTARRLAEETGLKADFVQGTVDEAPRLAPGPFDLVFTTWGALCWLPDMRLWARVIASVLAPGGELYCADAHPGFYVLEEFDGKLLPTYDYWTPPDRPLEFDNATTYYRRSNHHDASVDAGVDTSAVRDPRCTYRLGADNYDVSRARGVAVARRADAGAGTRWVVAASRRPSPHSPVVFGASEERGVRLLHCKGARLTIPETPLATADQVIE
jgi:SAM-dependent methyltransferase